MVCAVSRLAAFVASERILTAVNEKLPLDQQVTYPISFRKSSELRRMYGRFYPDGHLCKRIHRLSIVSLVTGAIAFAIILFQMR